MNDCVRSYNGFQPAEDYCNCIFGMLEDRFSNETDLENWFQSQTVGDLQLFVLPCTIAEESLQMTLPSEYYEFYAPDSTYSTFSENLLIQAFRETSDGLISHVIQASALTLTEELSNSDLIKERTAFSMEEVQDAMSERFDECEVWFSEKRSFSNLGDVYFLSFRGVARTDGLWQHSELVLFVRNKKLFSISSSISDKRYLVANTKVFQQALESIRFVRHHGGLILEGDVQRDTPDFISKESEVIFNKADIDLEIERVAVLPIVGEKCEGVVSQENSLADYVEGRLLGRYQMVDRRNLTAILDEQRLGLSGLLFEESAVEAGCISGAQGIIFVTQGCLQEQSYFQVRLIGCQTSELLWSCTGVNSDPKDLMSRILEEI